MEKPKFTNDKGTQIVLSLLKAHGVRRVVASPGTTNIALVASMQLDPWFEVYSAVDERGGAYMAVGMAAATGDPVVITCTGATASRNYYPAMTEAFYRKLPVIAITGSHGKEAVGNLQPQVIDRSVLAKDACLMSVEIDKICDRQSERDVILKVNNALLESRHRGGGPVHIDLRVGIGAGFTADRIPDFPKINRFMPYDTLPSIECGGQIAVYIGSHNPMSEALTQAIDKFCHRYRAVVFCDVSSGYNGRYKVATQLLLSQHAPLDSSLLEVDTMIHIGEVTGDYYSIRNLNPHTVWRVSEDGGVKDLFGTLSNVFEMREIDFFNHYNSSKNIFPHSENIYYRKLSEECKNLFGKKEELPFSNLWIADELRKHISDEWVIHFAIVNSERSFNLSDYSSLKVEMRCNVGGFGIDGPISTIIGSALVQKDKQHLLITGDLAFFYDLNSLGNRHLPSNLHILIVNNGKGTEFKNYDHPGFNWQDDADCFIAAGGHFGNQSRELVRGYAHSLGIGYLSAENKQEFNSRLSHFFAIQKETKGIIFEVFTNSEDESNALYELRTLSTKKEATYQNRLKSKIKGLLGRKS